MEKYEVLEKIGHGGQGSVFTVKKKSEGKEGKLFVLKKKVKRKRNL